ncbi:MAG: hypothetical protein GXY83_16100 [Rhodopirellula sp.]|nr:hypothetical protein [Rhodopirellula sp.]
MHTVDLLQEALKIAGQLGYRIRQEWLGGSGGGGCEIRGRRHLFLDLALTPADQLEIVLQVIQRHPEAASSAMPPQLKTLIQAKRAA